jgi:hypothetical protein
MRCNRDAHAVGIAVPSCTSLEITVIIIFKQTYGSFTTEADGRLSGHTMTITGKRSDGKYMVTHAFGSGKRIRKVYTPEQMLAEASKFEPVIGA